MKNLNDVCNNIRNNIEIGIFPTRYPTLEEHTWFEKNKDKILEISNDIDEETKELAFFFFS